MSDETIKEGLSEKLMRFFDQEEKSRYITLGLILVFIGIAAGYGMGSFVGYHMALIDFNLIPAVAP